MAIAKNYNPEPQNLINMFMFSDEHLKPHRKIVKQCRDSLEELLKETKQLNQLNWFWKGQEYENSLRKVKSKLEAWEDLLTHQTVDFRLKVKNDLKSDLRTIERLSKQIDEQIARKRWLKDKTNRTNSTVKMVFRVLKVVSVVLALFGIEVGALLLLAQGVAEAAVQKFLPAGEN